MRIYTADMDCSSCNRATNDQQSTTNNQQMRQLITYTQTIRHTKHTYIPQNYQLFAVTQAAAGVA